MRRERGFASLCHGAWWCVFAMIFVGILLPGCVVDYRDSNVQSFGPGEAVVLDGKQLYFTGGRDSFDEAVSDSTSKLTRPWGLPPFYYRVVTEQSEFLVDPVDHTPVDFTESDPFLIPGSDGGGFPTLFRGVYIGSDGTISLGGPGYGNGTLTDHYSSTQISVLPMDATVEGARVTYGVVAHAFVVTFENVDGNSVQVLKVVGYDGVERSPVLGQFINEDIVIVYRSVNENTRAGVVGISGGYAYDDAESVEELFGGEVDLTQNTDVSNGYVRVLDLP